MCIKFSRDRKVTNQYELKLGANLSTTTTIWSNTESNSRKKRKDITLPPMQKNFFLFSLYGSYRKAYTIDQKIIYSPRKIDNELYIKPLAISYISDGF